MKLLFDENIGKQTYRSIAKLLDALRPPVEHAHMLDFNQRQGVDDEDWVPKAASGGWIVITGDSGRSRLGAPLQNIMPEHGVTGIYFTGKLQQAPASVKEQAVAAILDRLAHVASAPKGTRFKLKRRSPAGFKLEVWPVTPRTRGG